MTEDLGAAQRVLKWGGGGGGEKRGGGRAYDERVSIRKLEGSRNPREIFGCVSLSNGWI